MREIKFRVWEENIKQMFYNVGIVNDELYLMLDGVGFDVVGDYREFKLMQYTGLKDKNGKEIYEGDLLKHPVGVVAEIKYDNDVASFIAVYTENDDIEMNHLDKKIISKCEVIGNIFEHPHLLEVEGK